MTTVSCPTCKRKVEWSAASRWRPFCSERCRLIDLGAWASERHVIPGEPLPDNAAGLDEESDSAQGPADR